MKLKNSAVLDRKVRALKPFDKRCTLDITGGLSKPPMEWSREIVRLFRLAQKLGRELGVEGDESVTGGGSDGNLTAWTPWAKGRML